jgi:hypothetical protein
MISVPPMPFSVRYVNQGNSAQPDLKPDPEVFKLEYFRGENLAGRSSTHYGKRNCFGPQFVDSSSSSFFLSIVVSCAPTPQQGSWISSFGGPIPPWRSVR